MMAVVRIVLCTRLRDFADIYIGVPELRNVKGKAVFAPYDRLSREEFEKLGYPKPHVNWKETKVRAIERFKRDMKDALP